MAWLAWQGVSLTTIQSHAGLRVYAGLPHPSLFPLEQVKFDCLTPSASLSNDRKVGSAVVDPLSLTVGRGSSPGDLDLTQFLQYGMERCDDI